MATSEERLKILTMLQEGRIDADTAAQLLEALGEGEKTRGAGPAASSATVTAEASLTAGSSGRWMRVRVTDTNSGKARVNIRIPISLVGAGLKMGMRFAPEVEGLDPEELMKIIRSGEMGQIVDVFDDEDGEHVEVFIE